ncbi:MAG: murein biosynthesis integral membrane protein MurJ [Propionibacteriaceae bacterium]|nr:murein biosynthesis integral membrane protein MurJ [Propionibacteriaceae bacterium]
MRQRTMDAVIVARLGKKSERLPMSEANPSRRLLDATAIMASGTLISRIFGLVRAVMIAFVLGNATMRVEAFSFALTVPNSLYILLVGGTLSNVLVPQIVRAITSDADGGKAFINRLLTGFIMLLGVLAVIITVGASWVMTIYTDDAWRGDEMLAHWQALLLMSFITMPQLFFYGVFYLLGQILNARGRFGAMMWAPIANNVIQVGIFGAYLAVWGTNASVGQPFTTPQACLLAAGSTLGIVVQTAVLIPFLKKAGFTYRPRFDLLHTGLGRTFHIAKWMVAYTTLTSLALLVVHRLLSTATSIDPITKELIRGAGLNAYQNGHLIWILPHSLIAVSLATAMMPSAARLAQAKEFDQLASEVIRIVRIALTFIVPASFAYLVLANPIANLIYSHGAGADDYHVIGWTLICFAIGLIPFSIQFLYLRAFYALDDTKTPFLLQLVISGIHVCLALALYWVMNWPQMLAPRMALAYSLAYLLGAVITHRALRKRLPQLDTSKLIQQLVKLTLASIPAAGVAWLIIWGFAGQDKPLQALGLLAALVGATVVFYLAARLMHIAEISQLLNVLRPGKPLPEAPEALLSSETDPPEAETGVISETEAESSTSNVRPDDEQTPLHPLTFPDPSTEEITITGTPQPDQLLAGRYRLEKRMSRKDSTQRWRVFDEVLQRYVLVYLFPPGDPKAATALDLARTAATATDSRILRILDIVPESVGQHGAYYVGEYVVGDTLAAILASGALSADETIWVVREVADALASCHGVGINHLNLSPATVLITANGNVKILGLVDEHVADDDGQARDVRALGELLFACLSAHWPNAAAYGLPGGGQAKLPGEIVKVPAAVDTVVDRILSANPKRWASPLTSAQEVTTALSLLLGPVSAAQDLRVRLDLPTGDVPLSMVVPPRAVHPYENEDSDPNSLPFMEAALENAEVFTPVPPPPTPKKKKRLPWIKD